MSVVIVGGNDRMVRQYMDLCGQYKCSAKVFTQINGLKNQIGSPDLMVLFTHTMSHKMLRCALDNTKQQNMKIVRSHSSSLSALRGILEEHAC